MELNVRIVSVTDTGTQRIVACEAGGHFRVLRADGNTDPRLLSMLSEQRKEAAITVEGDMIMHVRPITTVKAEEEDRAVDDVPGGNVQPCLRTKRKLLAATLRPGNLILYGKRGSGMAHCADELAKAWLMAGNTEGHPDLIRVDDAGKTVQKETVMQIIASAEPYPIAAGRRVIIIDDAEWMNADKSSQG